MKLIWILHACHLLDWSTCINHLSPPVIPVVGYNSTNECEAAVLAKRKDYEPEVIIWCEPAAVSKDFGERADSYWGTKDPHNSGLENRDWYKK